MAARWQGYEGWLQDLGAIEQKYCTNDGEDLESHPLDHYVQLWEGNESDNDSSDVDDDDSIDDDDESIISNDYNNDNEEDQQSYFQYEQNLLQNLRNIRANYKLISKSREKPSSDILTLNAEDFGHDLIQVKSAKEAAMQIDEQKPEVIGVGLFDWHMRITSQFSVILDGSKMKDRHEPWHTTVIKERVDNDPRKLKTVTGSVYILQTNINEKAMLQNDFPKTFIEQFRHGFPASWETVIKEFAVKFSLMRASMNDEKLVKSNEKQFEEKASVPVLQGTNTKLMRKNQATAILDSSTVRQENHKQRPGTQTRERRRSAVVSGCEDDFPEKREMPSRQRMEILSRKHQGQRDTSSEQSFDPLQIRAMPGDSRVSYSQNTVSRCQIHKGMSNEFLSDVAGASQNSSQNFLHESRDNISNETPKKERRPSETRQSSVKRKRPQRIGMPRRKDSGVTGKRFRMGEEKIKSEEEGNQSLDERVVSKCYESKPKGEGEIKSEGESHQSWNEDFLSNTYSYGDKLKSEPGVCNGLATMKRLKIESPGCSNTSDASNAGCHEDMINGDMYDGLKAMKKCKIESQIDCSTLETSNTNTQEAIIKKEIHLSDGLATVEGLKIESQTGYNTSGIANLQRPCTHSQNAGLLQPELGNLRFHGGSIKVKRKRRNNLRYRPGKNLSKGGSSYGSGRLGGEKFDISHRSRDVISNASQTDDGSTQPETSSEEYDKERFIFDQKCVKREIKVEDLAMSKTRSSLRGRKGSHLTKECTSLAKMQPECHDFLTAFDNSPLIFASADDHEIGQCKKPSKKLGHAAYQDIWAPLCESRGHRGIPKWDLFDDRIGTDRSNCILKGEELYVKKEGLLVEQNEPFIKKEEFGGKDQVEGHEKQGRRCKEKSFVIIAKEVSGSSDLDIGEDCQIVNVLNKGDRDEALGSGDRGSCGRISKVEGRKMSIAEGDNKRFADEAASGIESNKEQRGTTTQEQKASEHDRNFKEQDNYHDHESAQEVEDSEEFNSALSRQMIVNGTKGNATDKGLPCEEDKQVMVAGNGKYLSKEKDDREQPLSSQVQSNNAAVPSGSSDDLSNLSSDLENDLKSGGKHLDRKEIDSREDSLHSNYSLRSKKHGADSGCRRLEERGANELLRNKNKESDVVTSYRESFPNSRDSEGMNLAKKGTVSKQKSVQQKDITRKTIQENRCSYSEKGINVTQGKHGPVIDENEFSVTKCKQKANLKARRKAQRAKRENEISQLRSCNEMLSSDMCETESAGESDATDQGSAQRLTRSKVGLLKDRVKQNLMSENGTINYGTEEVSDNTDQECGQRMTRRMAGLLKERVEQTSTQNERTKDNEIEGFDDPTDQESAERIMTSNNALLRDRIEKRPERRRLEKRTLDYDKVEVSDATDQESRQIVTRSKVTSLKDRIKQTSRLEKGISNHEAEEGHDNTDQEEADQRMTKSKVALPRDRMKQTSRLEKDTRSKERVTVCDTTDQDCGKIVTRSMVGLLNGTVTQTSTLEKRTRNYQNDSTGKQTAKRDIKRVKPRMDAGYERELRMETKSGTVKSTPRASADVTNKSLKKNQQSLEVEKGTRSNDPETAVDQGKVFIESDCESIQNSDFPMKPIVAIRRALRKSQEKQEYEEDPRHRSYHPQGPVVEKRMLNETDIARPKSLPRKSPLATCGLLKSSHMGPGILKTSHKGRRIEGGTTFQSFDADNQDLNYYHKGARDLSQHQREIETKDHLVDHRLNCKQESRSSEDGKGRKSALYGEEFSDDEKVGLKRNSTTLYPEGAYVDDVFSEGKDKTAVRRAIQRQSPTMYPRGRTPYRVHFKEPNEEENDALKRMNPQESDRHPIILNKENSPPSRAVVEGGRKASTHTWTMSSRENEEKKARGSKFRGEKPSLKRRTDDEATASADRNDSSRKSMRRNQNIVPSAHIVEGKYTAVRPMSNKAVVDHDTHVLQSRDRRVATGSAQKGYGPSFVDISTNEDWSDEEIEKLKFALSHFHPNRPYFWQKVASFVGTKSSSSCQSQYEELKHPKKAEKIVKQSKKVNEKAKQIKTDTGASFQETVTAKRGTLRRKKQVREFLEAQDQGYEDDIFDSTPYRTRNRNITLPFDASRLAAACDFEDASEGDCDQEINTSSKDSPYDSSIGSTPGFLSPDILRPINRDEADAYMYRLKKKQPVQNVARHSAKKQAKRQNGNQRTYALANAGEILRKNNDRYDHDDDDDESEQDNYYSDDDDYDDHNEYQRHGYRC